MGKIQDLVVTNNYIQFKIVSNDCNGDFKGDKDKDYNPKIYLDTNGITIRCPEAKLRDQSTVNGKKYTVVDRAALMT